MKKMILGALAVTAALAAGPASAETRISVGLFTPAPVYAPPVAYYPPVQHVYYAPPAPLRPYYVEHRGRGHHPKHYARWGTPAYYGWR
jgi:hypothetical protein